MNRPRVFKILAATTAAATYTTIVLGGYVSSVGAGLACPDWPTCRGAVIPDLLNPLIFAEYVHRLFAVLTGLLVAAIASIAFLWFRADRRILSLSAASGILLAGQVALGALAITSRLDPVVVTSHLALAAATFAATTALAVVAFWVGPLRTSGGPLPT